MSFHLYSKSKGHRKDVHRCSLDQGVLEKGFILYPTFSPKSFMLYTWLSLPPPPFLSLQLYEVSEAEREWLDKGWCILQLCEDILILDWDSNFYTWPFLCVFIQGKKFVFVKERGRVCVGVGGWERERGVSEWVSEWSGRACRRSGGGATKRRLFLSVTMYST